jgi:hypothetical protein
MKSRGKTAESRPASASLKPLLLALSATLLLGLFSPPVVDSDFWWHLKTGQYITQRHTLPVPDPFAFTTAGAGTAYAGEELTRHFNLTHEWLAQVLLYGAYNAAGFAGVVLLRAGLLTAFCAVVGLIVWRRTGGFLRSVGAALAAAAVAVDFALDRPYLITFLLLALTAAILEYRRWLWALPAIFVIWANCHGGFFLGWIVVGAYSAEALWRRTPDCRKVLLASAAAVLASGLNPSGFRILEILLSYRRSFLQSTLLEWSPARLWPPSAFSVLLIAAAAVLVYSAKRVRLVDWLLYAAFAAAAMTAYRNIVLVGFWAPIPIASYLPWNRRVPTLAQWAAAALLLVAVGTGIARGCFFQFHTEEWKWPSGAADFLQAHHVTQPIFNSYEYGGYLMWRLWPQQRTFIDGRALSESVFNDYARILYNHDETGGKSAAQLLDQYGVDVIVMNGFEYVTGNAYMLAPALADPQQTTWKLVYADPQSMVFMRTLPPGVQPLPSLRVLDALEAGCNLHLEREPQYPRCARALGQMFSKIGNFPRARRWLATYLDHPHDPDPQAEEAYRKLVGQAPGPAASPPAGLLGRRRSGVAGRPGGPAPLTLLEFHVSQQPCIRVEDHGRRFRVRRNLKVLLRLRQLDTLLLPAHTDLNRQPERRTALRLRQIDFHFLRRRIVLPPALDRRRPGAV